MYKLPEKWLSLTLGDVVDYAVNSTIQPEAMSTEQWLLELEDIERDTSRVLTKQIVGQRKPKSAKNKFSSGDILYGKLRPYLNKVVRAGDDGYCSSEIVPISPGILDGGYLLYQMRAPIFLGYVVAATHGIRMPRLGTEQARAAPFLLAPLPEQERIAQKLDALLERVYTLKTRLDAMPDTIKRFRQSVLLAATTGVLTGNALKKMRGASILQSPLVFLASEQAPEPDNWRWEKLVNVAVLESGHTPRKSVAAYWENGNIPWISLQDIRAADGKEIFQTKFMPTTLGIEKSSARLLPAGTICFSRDISVGFVTMMGRSMATTQHFANWICGNALLPKYLMYAFMAGRGHLTRSSQGSTVATIYMPALKEIRLMLPPMDEQIEIVQRVERLLAFADQLEAKITTAKALIDELTQSILAKAFRGELVPQDPNDEPASVLLERIRAQRAATPKAKRGRKGKAD